DPRIAEDLDYRYTLHLTAADEQLRYTIAERDRPNNWNLMRPRRGPDRPRADLRGRGPDVPADGHHHPAARRAQRWPPDARAYGRAVGDRGRPVRRLDQ